MNSSKNEKVQKISDIYSEEKLISQAENEYNEYWLEYSKLKAENPEHIFVYQVGDFFEIMGDDAKIVSKALKLQLGERDVSGNNHIPMVGFPVFQIKTYINMLTDRGYDITVAEVEGGEREVYSVVSMNKENPVQSVPVGRIDYLHTDGRVRESIEYTDPYQFEKDVKEENFYGVPMKIVLYADKDGKTIEHGFVSELNPLQGLLIMESPYSDKPLAVRLVDFYKQYNFHEYQNSLKNGDTDEDAVKRIQKDLQNPKAVASLLQRLRKISSDTVLSAKQEIELDFLMRTAEALKQSLFIWSQPKFENGVHRQIAKTTYKRERDMLKDEEGLILKL